MIKQVRSIYSYLIDFITQRFIYTVTQPILEGGTFSNEKNAGKYAPYAVGKSASSPYLKFNTNWKNSYLSYLRKNA